jgi:hypothetical protein
MHPRRVDTALILTAVGSLDNARLAFGLAPRFGDGEPGKTINFAPSFCRRRRRRLDVTPEPRGEPAVVEPNATLPALYVSYTLSLLPAVSTSNGSNHDTSLDGDNNFHATDRIITAMIIIRLSNIIADERAYNVSSY